jgi:phage regulator Rha-like protein
VFPPSLDNYQTEAEQEFGIYLFETDKLKGRGRPQKYVLLTEDQSNFLLTLVDNTSQSVKLKAKLVRAFSQAKELLKAKFSASYWYKRLGLAMSDMDKPLQARYFCIYLEMMRFFNELEVRLGYVVPDVNLVTDEYVIPDVSIGKLCLFLFVRSIYLVSSEVLVAAYLIKFLLRFLLGMLLF